MKTIKLLAIFLLFAVRIDAQTSTVKDINGNTYKVVTINNRKVFSDDLINYKEGPTSNLFNHYTFFDAWGNELPDPCPIGWHTMNSVDVNNILAGYNAADLVGSCGAGGWTNKSGFNAQLLQRNVGGFINDYYDEFFYVEGNDKADPNGAEELHIQTINKNSSYVYNIDGASYSYYDADYIYHVRCVNDTNYYGVTPVITSMNISTCTGVPFDATPVNGVNGIVPPGTTYSWATPQNKLVDGRTSGKDVTKVTGNLKNFTDTIQTAVYTITPRDSSYTGAPFNLTVTVYTIPKVVASGGGTICSGKSATISASGAKTYSWSGGIGSGDTKTVNPFYSTTYTVTGKDTFGCTYTGTVGVSVKHTPATPTITRSGNYLISSSSVGIQWYYNGILQNNTTGDMAASKGKYFVTVKQDGCISDASNTIDVTSLVGINESIKTESNIKIYPNPTSDKFTIEIDNQNISYNLEILNTLGQVILTKKIINPIEQIDLTGQPAGVYFVKLQSISNAIIKKIIKE